MAEKKEKGKAKKKSFKKSVEHKHTRQKLRIQKTLQQKRKPKRLIHSRRRAKAKKPKVGIFSMTSCSGCQMKVLDLEKELLSIVNLVDITSFPLAKAANKKGPFDISFVEGAVITKENLDALRAIRKQSKYLVAIGACATHAGIPYMKHFLEKEDILGLMCPVAMKGAIEPSPLDCHVDVDLRLTGCPVDKHEFLYALKQLLLGKVPDEYTKPVCIECRKKGNICLLNIKGQECIGPITNGGCGALCPSHGIPCSGCKGPTEDGNVDYMVKLLEQKGYSKEQIRRVIRRFAGISKKFEKIKYSSKRGG